EYVGDDPGHLAERRGHELHRRTDPHVRRVRERGLTLGIELHLPVLPDDGAGGDRGGDREGEVLTAAVDDDLRRGLATGADRAGDLLPRGDLLPAPFEHPVTGLETRGHGG